MNNTSKLVTGLVVVGGLTALYFLVVKPKLMTKEKAIDTIIKKGYYTGGRTVLATFDEPYIMAWGKAAKKDEQTFSYQGRTYMTQGGRAA